MMDEKYIFTNKKRDQCYKCNDTCVRYLLIHLSIIALYDINILKAMTAVNRMVNKWNKTQIKSRKKEKC